MLLLRLCPLVPFSALNYIGGVTGISWRDFAASLVGILPMTILTVLLGASTGSLVDESEKTKGQQLWFIIIFCSGLAFGIIAIVYTWKLVRRELQSVRTKKCSFVVVGKGKCLMFIRFVVLSLLDP
jgi:uncharacterized membrane protein YdjX (TVP38/TMEM64 family)